MHVEFIARGTGSAGAAADYLLGERDAAGNVRDGIEVRRGDPDRVAAVADALEFEHKYTSGVIAWAPEDRPTDAQIEAVLDKFEQTAWAGLEPDRYRGRPRSTASGAAACTCTSSPPGATWRRARASTSRRRAGRKPSACCATPSTTSTAGAGLTTRRGRGRSSPGTAPTSTRRSCAPGWRSRPTRARSSGTTWCSASSTASCATAPMLSPRCRKRDSTCRGRARTT